MASVLGAKDNKKDYMEGDCYVISWCYGHLVELAPPAAYGEQYKRWSRNALPIIPKEWKYIASEGKQRQLETLRTLMERPDVDTVVNACDSGREGEFIFHLVYNFCKCKKPVKRLWLSSMEEAAIVAGFQNLRPGADYENLYSAALCRAKADYLVGFNATRLFSCLYGGATLNVGRVQTPTLAMLVEREAAVEAFVPEAFFTPAIRVIQKSSSSQNSILASGERLTSREEAETVRKVCDGRDAVVISIENKEIREYPPKLYDLTALQREANRLFGYTAKQTLDVAQSLYERRLITYPRTNSRYLTRDFIDSLEELVNLTAMRLPFIRVPLPVSVGLVVDDSRVSDHHALLPTLEAKDINWNLLPSAEFNILRMIIIRLVCAVNEPHLYEAVTVALECGGYEFIAKGKTILRNGWKSIDADFSAYLKRNENNSGDEFIKKSRNAMMYEAPCEDGVLPEFSVGQVLSPVVASVHEGETSPPKRFSEDLILAAMESAGAEDMPTNIDDSITEKYCLGTPATRAGIIEKLIKSGFVERKKKLLVPTQKGVNLIAVLPDELKSSSLTSNWEQKLYNIERGDLDVESFMADIAAMTRSLVDAHTAAKPEFASAFVRPASGEIAGACPRCGKPVRENTKAFSCEERCGFVLWKDNRFFVAKGKTLEIKTVKALLKDGSVFFSDLKSEKTGKTYAARIFMEYDGNNANFKLDFSQPSTRQNYAHLPGKDILNGHNHQT